MLNDVCCFVQFDFDFGPTAASLAVGTYDTSTVLPLALMLGYINVPLISDGYSVVFHASCEWMRMTNLLLNLYRAIMSFTTWCQIFQHIAKSKHVFDLLSHDTI